jgi:hypothetical protein
MRDISNKPRLMPVPLSLRDTEMALCGLKIWRQVVVAQTFAELRDGSVTPYQETLVDIDLAIDRLEHAKGKF